jgi:hypothetical protein
LELETKEALDSCAWLNMSSNSILEFLDMECLNINEADLLKALMRGAVSRFKSRTETTLMKI